MHRRRAVIWLLLLAGITAGVAAIAAGLFDPRPLGEQQFSTALAPITVAPGDSRQVWQAGSLPPPPFTVRLTVGPVTGEQDAGYGLLLGDGRMTLVTAVSPLGYVAVWQTISTTAAAPQHVLLPWQPWPHVSAGANEIWMDVRTDRLTLRVNRERLWEAAPAFTPTSVGAMATSYGATATVHFDRVTIWAPDRLRMSDP